MQTTSQPTTTTVYDTMPPVETTTVYQVGDPHKKSADRSVAQCKYVTAMIFAVLSVGQAITGLVYGIQLGEFSQFVPGTDSTIFVCESLHLLACLAAIGGLCFRFAKGSSDSIFVK